MCTFYGRVDRFLSHRSVSRPFAAGYRDKIRGTDMHDVIPGERLRVRFIRIGNERPDAAPRREIRPVRNVAIVGGDAHPSVRIDDAGKRHARRVREICVCQKRHRAGLKLIQRERERRGAN